MLDLGDRQLQEPLAERAEGFRITGGEKPVRAFARLLVLDPLAIQRAGDVARRLLSRG